MSQVELTCPPGKEVAWTVTRISDKHELGEVQAATWFVARDLATRKFKAERHEITVVIKEEK